MALHKPRNNEYLGRALTAQGPTVFSSLRKGMTMNYLNALSGFILAFALLAGCGKEDEKPVPSMGGGEAADTHLPAPPAGGPDTIGTTERQSDSSAQVKPSVEQPGAEDATAIQERAESEAAGQGQAALAKEQLVKEAQSQFDKLMRAIKDGKLADAEQLLADLEARLSALPEPWPERIAAARRSLEGAKAAESVKSLVPKN